jgi:hypothetical protein
LSVRANRGSGGEVMSRKPEEATDLGYEFIGKAKLPKGFSFP